MSNNKSGMVNVDDHARQIALEAVKIYRQQEKDKKRRNSLYNIGKLMAHYIDFVDHYENIKYRASDINDDLYVLLRKDLDEDDISIKSIKRSKARTMIMISQINTAMHMLEVSMSERQETEKAEVVKRLYMDRSKKDISFNKKVLMVVEEMRIIGKPCSESSVKRWNNEMLDELAIRLFGVDGLKLDF